MPLISTRGAASAQGFGEFARAAAPIYIEDVFSTYLYTGTASAITINNGIDLSTKGGLVWTKQRSSANDHVLIDTVRGSNQILYSNLTFGNDTNSTAITAFNSSGYVYGTYGAVNQSGQTYASWTFREQAKFFDVVTYTGNGVSGRTVAHNLGSVPGCMIIKRLNGTSNWPTYHRSLSSPQNNALLLNLTNAALGAGFWTANPTDTVFSLSSDADVNENGGTYVAYLFAHDAGGFGLTGTDNVISCGSYVGTGTTLGPTVDLGYEPQWILLKPAGTPSPGNQPWLMIDTMRGWTVENDSSGGPDATLEANSSIAEDRTNSYLEINSRGFVPKLGARSNASGITYIYVAIRRGPMKIPTSGTSVFAPVTYTGNNSARTLTSNFPVDLEIIPNRDGGQSWSPSWVARLTNNGVWLASSSTAAETNQSSNIETQFQSNVGVNRTNNFWNTSGQNLETFMFRRAPSFFDVVCYIGNGSARTISHNLGVAPELMILKSRENVNNWPVYHSAFSPTETAFLNLATNADPATPNTWNSTAPTSSVFSLGTANNVNQNGIDYIAYLFATCPGVSKVGSYTGTGALQTINCGFTSGARFVMIKRYDDVDPGAWYVWDSARGISSGNDPYLLMNSTAAEVTNTNFVDTTSVGFQVTAAAPAAVNGSGGLFIFLAIA